MNPTGAVRDNERITELAGGGSNYGADFIFNNIIVVQSYCPSRIKAIAADNNVGADRPVENIQVDLSFFNNEEAPGEHRVRRSLSSSFNPVSSRYGIIGDIERDGESSRLIDLQRAARDFGIIKEYIDIITFIRVEDGTVYGNHGSYGAGSRGKCNYRCRLSRRARYEDSQQWQSYRQREEHFIVSC